MINDYNCFCFFLLNCVSLFHIHIYAVRIHDDIHVDILGIFYHNEIQFIHHQNSLEKSYHS